MELAHSKSAGPPARTEMKIRLINVGLRGLTREENMKVHKSSKSRHWPRIISETSTATTESGFGPRNV